MLNMMRTIRHHLWPFQMLACFNDPLRSLVARTKEDAHQQLGNTVRLCEAHSV